MPLRYCSVHARLFHPERQAWVNRSQDYINMIKRVGALLASAEIDCADYIVIETACDRCIERARQGCHGPGEQLDPPP